VNEYAPADPADAERFRADQPSDGRLGKGHRNRRFSHRDPCRGLLRAGVLLKSGVLHLVLAEVVSNAAQ
jgi:hypothetical protein